MTLVAYYRFTSYTVKQCTCISVIRLFRVPVLPLIGFPVFRIFVLAFLPVSR
jgi:hypothetical protein